MKKLACEMCGSTNVIKKDGLWVCQSCGAKYSPEEAKKMMVEGTVKVDTSSEIVNLKKLAKRHYDNGEYEKSEDYYNKVIELNPDDWEAVYYKGLSSAFQSTFINIRIEESVIGAKNAIGLIKSENLDKKKGMFRTDLLNVTMLIGNLVFDFEKNLDYFPGGSSEKLIENIFHLIGASEEILDIFPTKKVVKDDVVFLLYTHIVRWCYDLCKFALSEGNLKNYVNHGYFNLKSRSFAIEKHDYYIEKIKECDPSYESLDIKTADKSSGCYIATSVYGSYDCPEVWTLRRFRDNNLSKTFYGQLFVKIYYAFSPTLVNYFGDKKLFKKLFKTRLDRLVEKLQEDGVESTYYIDK